MSLKREMLRPGRAPARTKAAEPWRRLRARRASVGGRLREPPRCGCDVPRVHPSFASHPEVEERTMDPWTILEWPTPGRPRQPPTRRPISIQNSNGLSLPQASARRSQAEAWAHVEFQWTAVRHTMARSLIAREGAETFRCRFSVAAACSTQNMNT